MSKVLEITGRASRERLTGDLGAAAGLYRIAAALAGRGNLPAMAETATRAAVECEAMILAAIAD